MAALNLGGICQKHSLATFANKYYTHMKNVYCVVKLLPHTGDRVWVLHEHPEAYEGWLVLQSLNLEKNSIKGATTIL